MNATDALEAIAAYGGEVRIVDGRPRLHAPKPLPPEVVAAAREHRDEIMKLALAGAVSLSGDTRESLHDSALCAYARSLAPVVRFTVHETTDVEGDVAFLRRVRALLEEFPGDNRCLMRIVALAGTRPVVEWRVLASEEFRHALAGLLVGRASGAAAGLPEVARV